MKKAPNKETENALKPFLNNDDYLESLFVLLDLLLFAEPDSRMEQYGLSGGQSAVDWNQKVLERLSLSEETGFTPALEDVIALAGLPGFMRIIIAYLLRVALDPAYEREAAGEFWQDSLNLSDLLRITVSAGLTDASGDADYHIFDLLSEAEAGLSLLFPQLARKDMIGSITPVMDRRLAAICMGREEKTALPCGIYYLDTDSAEMTSAEGPDESDNSGTVSEDGNYETGNAAQDTLKKISGTREELASDLVRRADLMPPEIVILWGQEGSGKKSVMKRVAKYTGRSAAVLPLKSLLPDENEPDYPIYPDAALLVRECVLTGSIPVIDGLANIPREKAVRLLDMLRTDSMNFFPAVYLLMETEEIPDEFRDVYCLEMPSIRTADRIRLWEKAIGKDTISRENLVALANTFALTPGQLYRSAAQAIRLAGPDRKVTEDILYQVCYASLGHPLKQYSQRVKSSFTWDDLKMAPEDKVVLRDLCRSVRNRHIVMQEWEFERKVPYGAGITALFSGPPGTGKTMAAQVIANDLHMELYKIDVSQLIDKYVGETEKTIRRVFEQAKKSNSVLFFDEADAIFNKRMEAKNSNERFANIESSLLLQCIEEYDGVALLATNNMANIDAAFIRRFRFYLTFKEPNEKIRREIWESVFPDAVPLSDEIDFKELAHIFSFNGAVIKNVALQSAYLAAQEKKPIGLLEILVAVRREMEKNQRVLAQEKMGRLGYLLPQVLKWGKNSD